MDIETLQYMYLQQFFKNSYFPFKRTEILFEIMQ